MKHIEELKLLERQLREGLELPDGWRFDMFNWKNDTDCGTVCCAIGYHITFNETGMILNGKTVEPEYNNYDEYDAIANYFSISVNQVEYMFYPGTYSGDITQAMVADRIDEVFRKYGY